MWDKTDDEIINALRLCPQINALTMPPQRRNPDFITRLTELGIPTYLHTINIKEEWERYKGEGTHGIYTDWLCGGGMTLSRQEYKVNKTFDGYWK